MLALSKVFGKSAPVSGMPYGRKMRLDPFTADPLGIEPLAELQREVKAALAKHRQYLENTVVYREYGIKDLDYGITYGDEKVTAREAFLRIKASDQTSNLFEFMEKTRDGITFLFHSSLHHEAEHIISYAPIILQQKFGSRVWTWFTKSKEFQMSPYY